MSDLNLIDPKVFAEGKQKLQGNLRLGELDEHVSSYDYPADSQTEISLTLQGGHDLLQRLFLELAVKADVPLICQRCIKPMPFKLDETSRIVLFADDENLDAAMLADDELEGTLTEKELDVRGLVEDQILMALSFSPRHKKCGNVPLAQINQDKPNPLAVLADLKKQPRAALGNSLIYIIQEFEMTVQQSRKSPSKRGMHRSHDALTSPALSVDSTTDEIHRPHHISPNGMYCDRKVVKAKGE